LGSTGEPCEASAIGGGVQLADAVVGELVIRQRKHGTIMRHPTENRVGNIAYIGPKTA
jgi:hypothetical protein